MSPSNTRDEDKRPGNVFYTPGTKTPRKVQWLDKDPNSSAHSLDEEGLNPVAFQRLVRALERHNTASTSKVHHYPPQPEPAHTMDISDVGATPRFISANNSTTHLSTDHSINDTNSSHSSTSVSPHHFIPGNFIEATERAGLPGLLDHPNNAHRQAEKVVNSHRKGLFGFSSKRKKRIKKLPGMHWRTATESGDSTDVERDADGETVFVGGGGVLSALLSLYGESTGSVSGLSTPRHLSLDDPPEKPWLRRKDEHQHQHRQEEYRPPSHLATEVIQEELEANPTQQPILSQVGREPKSERFKPASLLHRKNSKTRSGAGVFGPLVASTGNLTGFAAPLSSTLQPDIKRPGYRLSRYSYEEKPKMSREPPKFPSHPRSMYDEPYSQASSVCSTPGPPSPTSTDPGPTRAKWSGILRDMPVPSIRSFGGRSGASTPARSVSPSSEAEGYFDFKHPTEEEKRWEKRKKRKRDRIFITRHVANILERQEFIMKFARAMMMFGGPSHRLQAQISSTARVLDLQLSCVYFPDVLLISFDDNSTSTSNVKFIRQGSSLDLEKLAESYRLYWKVIYDKLSVSDASVELDVIMRRPQRYNWWKLIFFGGMCSSSICSVSFGGSFIDSLIVFPLGALLIAIQLLSVRNELYSNVFEVTVTTLFSFLAAALAASRHFCYSAVASSSVVLILPGFIVLNGALEIMSRNIVAGSVRLCYAVMYALFLGFGLAMGAKAFQEITRTQVIGSTDIVCAISHDPNGPWYQKTPSKMWAFLTVPMFSLFLSLRNQAPYDRRELPLLVGIACVGWVTNHFTGTKFVGQSDISAAVGAFAVGIVANLYARLFRGNAFVVMITGILFQLPSGLGSGGLLTYVSQQARGDSSSYISGFQTALKLISVAIGLTVGLGISLVVMHPIQSKRRAGGIFSL